MILGNPVLFAWALVVSMMIIQAGVIASLTIARFGYENLRFRFVLPKPLPAFGTALMTAVAVIYARFDPPPPELEHYYFGAWIYGTYAVASLQHVLRPSSKLERSDTVRRLDYGDVRHLGVIVAPGMTEQTCNNLARVALRTVIEASASSRLSTDDLRVIAEGVVRDVRTHGFVRTTTLGILALAVLTELIFDPAKAKPTDGGKP